MAEDKEKKKKAAGADAGAASEPATAATPDAVDAVDAATAAASDATPAQEAEAAPAQDDGGPDETTADTSAAAPEAKADDGGTEAAPDATAGEAKPPQPAVSAKPAKPRPQPKGHEHYATGRRKTSVARVFLKAGEGNYTVNGKPLTEYFQRESNRILAQQALEVVGLNDGKVDLLITVRGGGETGQAGAVRHGIARVLAVMDPALKPILRKASPNLIMRDTRMVERKKVALRGARRAPQYSKR